MNNENQEFDEVMSQINEKKEKQKKIIKTIFVLLVLVLVLYVIFHHRHKFEPATCTTPATCKCGETMGVANGHTWEAATCEKPKTCKVCGSKEGNALGHDYSEATCTEPAICKVCGVTEGEPKGHQYAAGSCTEDEVCLVCGDRIKAPGHKYTEATCTEASVCEACGEVKSEALGHQFSNGNCVRCELSLGDKDLILSASKSSATCETKRMACLIDMGGENPYDVVWDYGEEWNRYVEQCDWSLVFDASYYKKAYPMLSILYDGDEAYLLKHFATIGVHEGRQGCASFNVQAYLDNCDPDLSKAFQDDVEGAYLYYMLHYDTEKDVETKVRADQTKPETQLFHIYTQLQKDEIAAINKYRQEVDSDTIELDSEMCCFANFRARINRVTGSKMDHGHDWAIEHNDTMIEYLYMIDSTAKGLYENTVTSKSKTAAKDYAYMYYISKEHYDAMVDPVSKVAGVSNVYYSRSDRTSSQFDMYIIK